MKETRESIKKILWIAISDVRAPRAINPFHPNFFSFLSSWLK